MVARILTISYLLAALACVLFGPKEGATALALVAALITLPIFITMLLRQIFIMGVIAVILAVVSILLPPLGFLALAWAAISFVLKFVRLARNLLPIAAGCGMYALLFVLPIVLSWVSREFVVEVPLSIALAAAGGFLFHGMVALLTRIGYKPAIAASMMLGFPVYLTLFALTFLLPGFEAGGNDGDL